MTENEKISTENPELPVKDSNNESDSNAVKNQSKSGVKDQKKATSTPSAKQNLIKSEPKNNQKLSIWERSNEPENDLRITKTVITEIVDGSESPIDNKDRKIDFADFLEMIDRKPGVYGIYFKDKNNRPVCYESRQTITQGIIDKNTKPKSSEQTSNNEAIEILKAQLKESSDRNKELERRIESKLEQPAKQDDFFSQAEKFGLLSQMFNKNSGSNAATLAQLQDAEDKGYIKGKTQGIDLGRLDAERAAKAKYSKALKEDLAEIEDRYAKKTERLEEREAELDDLANELDEREAKTESRLRKAEKLEANIKTFYDKIQNAINKASTANTSQNRPQSEAVPGENNQSFFDRFFGQGNISESEFNQINADYEKFFDEDEEDYEDFDLDDEDVEPDEEELDELEDGEYEEEDNEYDDESNIEDDEYNEYYEDSDESDDEYEEIEDEEYEEDEEVELKRPEPEKVKKQTSKTETARPEKLQSNLRNNGANSSKGIANLKKEDLKEAVA